MCHAAGKARAKRRLLLARTLPPPSVFIAQRAAVLTNSRPERAAVPTNSRPAEKGERECSSPASEIASGENNKGRLCVCNGGQMCAAKRARGWGVNICADLGSRRGPVDLLEGAGGSRSCLEQGRWATGTEVGGRGGLVPLSLFQTLSSLPSSPPVTEVVGSSAAQWMRNWACDRTVRGPGRHCTLPAPSPHTLIWERESCPFAKRRKKKCHGCRSVVWGRARRRTETARTSSKAKAEFVIRSSYPGRTALPLSPLRGWLSSLMARPVCFRPAIRSGCQAALMPVLLSGCLRKPNQFP